MNSALERLLSLWEADAMRRHIAALSSGQIMTDAAIKLMERKISNASVVNED